METRVPAAPFQDITNRMGTSRPVYGAAKWANNAEADPKRSRASTGGPSRTPANNRNAIRAERYRESEARLLQSLRQCQVEPSVHELKIRTLERATHLLSQLAQESSNQAKQLAAMTADRASVLELDPDLYRSMQSQRWRAERRQESISHYMKVIQQAASSLNSTFISPDAGTVSSAGKHEEHALGLEDRSRTNLVAFLCRPQRVAPLHRRSRSRLLRACLRPLYLNSTSITSAIIQTSLTTTITTTSSDSTLDMRVETPLVTISLTGQQAQLRSAVADGEERGTATILSPTLPPPNIPDPSTIEVALPDYVHDLLSNFDAAGKTLPSASSTIKFQHDDTTSSNTSGVKSSSFSSLWQLRKERRPRNVQSHPHLHSESKSSLKRLSGIWSIAESLSSRRKTILKEDVSKTVISEVGGGDGDGIAALAQSPVSPKSNTMDKPMSKIGRRISVGRSKHRG